MNRAILCVETLETRDNPSTFFPTTLDQLTDFLATASSNSQADVIDLGGRTFTLTAALDTISSDGGNALTIRNGTLERASSAGDFRLVTIAADASLTLHRVTLRGGNVPNFGGAIFNAGSLTITDSTISNSNAGSGFGGGIFNDTTGNITLISNTTIAGNDAATGGGIYNQGTITTITGSTISLNDGQDGGGLTNVGTVHSVTNSTFSGNSASQGGGILNNGSITLVANSTIARNTASSQGGGIHNAGSISMLSSTIIGDNEDGGAGADLHNTNAITTAKDNLIENAAGHAIANGSSGNLVGVDPMLTALSNNGGSTFTHALIAGSPAIDAGDNDQGLDVDQRGFNTRAVNDLADIGAYESGATAPPSTTPEGLVDLFAVGIDPGPGGNTDPRIRVYNADGSLRFELQVYEQQFRGGVRVATGDVTGDGIDDVITGAGIGGGPRVRVFDGATGNPVNGLLGSFFAFDDTSSTGIYVAAGDVDNDGHDDVIVSQEVGGSSEVRVFSGGDGTLLASFFAYDSGYTGGVRVAAGNVLGDDRDEIIAAPGFGAVADVRIFEGVSGEQLSVFRAFDQGYTGGAYVATGDVNGDGLIDVVVSTGSQQKTLVGVYDNASQALTRNFDAYADADDESASTTEHEGVQVATVDVDGDGRDEILTGRGLSSLSRVKVFHGVSLAQLDAFFAFDSQEGTTMLGTFVG